MKRKTLIVLSFLLAAVLLMPSCASGDKNASDTVQTSAATLESTTAQTQITSSQSVKQTVETSAVTSSQASSSATAMQTEPLPTATAKKPAVAITETYMSHVFDGYDKNSLYINVQRVIGGVTVASELATDGKNVYSSVIYDDGTKIYLSNGKVTFLLDSATKTYTVPYLYPLAIDYEYSYCCDVGKGTFNGKECEYEAFYGGEEGQVFCHFFDENKKWVGYEEYHNNELVETTVIIGVSSNIPSHIFFVLPVDYTFYFEETPITPPSEWFGDDQV